MAKIGVFINKTSPPCGRAVSDAINIPYIDLLANRHIVFSVVSCSDNVLSQF